MLVQSLVLNIQVLTRDNHWFSRWYGANLGNSRGLLQCVKTVSIHSSDILSVKVGEQWLAIGAADNSMSLFHRIEQRPGVHSNMASKMAGWQLYRTPQRTAAMVRCVASDIDRGRICSGGRNGILRLWEPTVQV